MTSDLERDDTTLASNRRWGLGLGLAVLAMLVTGAVWATQIDFSSGGPQSRTAELELRHESRDIAAEGPLVPIGTVWETEVFEPLAHLAPGETIVTEVRVTRFEPWTTNDSGLKVEFGELAAGWVVEGLECTGAIGVQPLGPRQMKLGFIDLERPDDEVVVSCTVWTRPELAR